MKTPRFNLVSRALSRRSFFYSLMAWVCVSLPVAWADSVILDSTDSTGIEITGSWTSSVYFPGYYGTNYIHDGNTGKGSKSVLFRPSLPREGYYQVFLRWVSDSNRADNVPVTISSAIETNTFYINQQQGGGAWHSMGTRYFGAGTNSWLRVSNSNTTGFVIVDAVRFQEAALVDNSETDIGRVQLAGSWSTSTNVPGYYATNFLHDGNTGKGTKTVTYRPVVGEAGLYDVLMRWTSDTSRSTNVPVTVASAYGTNTVHLNQSVGGGGWNMAGKWFFKPGTNAWVRLANTNTTGYVIADAIRLEKSGEVLDQSDTGGVTISSGWLSSAAIAGFYGTNYLHDENTGKGSKSVAYTPPLMFPGTYDLSLWWSSNVDRSTNTPVDVIFNGGSDAISLDQRGGGDGWLHLGNYSFLAGTNGTVTVGNAGTSGYVTADAARFLPEDTDKDGLPDGWELLSLGDLSQGAEDDADQDGWVNAQELEADSDPADFYNGDAPTLSIQSGNNQSGLTNSVLPEALSVLVSASGGGALTNAPVTFSASIGGVTLAASTNAVTWQSSISLRTDTNGLASLWGKLPATAGTNQVMVIPTGITNSNINFNLISVLPAPLNPPAAISAGAKSSFAVRNHGDLLVWGANSLGQLGSGSRTNLLTATAHSLTNVTSLASGFGHTIALLNDGTVKAWGINSSGQLGDGTRTDRLTAVGVSGLSNIVAVAAGHSHSIALDGSGAVWTWGANDSSQLGRTNSYESLAPAAVPGLPNVVAVAAGKHHSMALKQDGTVWTWGGNVRGQLGNTNLTAQATPIEVPIPEGITAIVAGQQYSLAKDSTGHLWVWGANSSGQLGLGDRRNRFVPTLNTNIATISKLAAASEHSLVSLTNQTVWAWGANLHGQTGVGTNVIHTAPAQISTLSNITAIASGEDHSLFLDSNGKVFATGLGATGQLGQGNTNSIVTPVEVPGLEE